MPTLSIVDFDITLVITPLLFLVATSASHKFLVILILLTLCSRWLLTLLLCCCYCCPNSYPLSRIMIIILVLVTSWNILLSSCIVKCIVNKHLSRLMHLVRWLRFITIPFTGQWHLFRVGWHFLIPWLLWSVLIKVVWHFIG